MNDRTLLTTREAAAYLNVKERTLGAHWYRWGLRPSRIGRANRYRVSDLHRYLADHRISEPRRVA
jgi:excisionase family DNA binding protein